MHDMYIFNLQTNKFKIRREIRGKVQEDSGEREIFTNIFLKRMKKT
jgi:hypothetical protein